MQEREKLKSRLGFLLISAGCAIGIGNVWKFAYVAGQGGGGAVRAHRLWTHHPPGGQGHPGWRKGRHRVHDRAGGLLRQRERGRHRVPAQGRVIVINLPKPKEGPKRSV